VRFFALEKSLHVPELFIGARNVGGGGWTLFVLLGFSLKLIGTKMEASESFTRVRLTPQDHGVLLIAKGPSSETG
jgi:hypothetical protein